MKSKLVTFSNSVIKDRIEVLENSEPRLVFRTFLAPHGGQNQMHYHTKINERFNVIQGQLSLLIDNTEKTLTAGEHYTVEKRTNHMFFNATDKLVIFDVEVEKPKKMIQGLQIMYGLANEGKTTEGLPKNPLYIASPLKMMDAFSPKIPHFIQATGITVMATLSRQLGIEDRLIKKYCD